MPLRQDYLKTALLAALLLLGQTAVLAHQFSHDLQAVDVSCTQCLTQSVFDGAATTGIQTVPVVHGSVAPPASNADTVHSPYLLTASARAPPAVSL